jgi:transposase
MKEKVSAENRVREIRRKTRKKYSSEEKVRIVLEGLRGEESIAELCRREGIPSNLYYRWSKEFLEAGRKRLAGDTKREATSSEVTELRAENEQLKQAVAEMLLKNRFLKKALNVSESEISDIGGNRDRRSWKPSGWSKTRSCQLQRRYGNWESPAARSTAGTGDTGIAFIAGLIWPLIAVVVAAIVLIVVAAVSGS